MSKRDGPYLILTQNSLTSYFIARLDKPSDPIVTYRTSALTHFRKSETFPVLPIKKFLPSTKSFCRIHSHMLRGCFNVLQEELRRQDRHLKQ
ncbi:hypothetical protein CEXT_723141 [Caerostris extrusa]|uniref:Uncharacterized protein n=1 Tax=Caerostris extrusa TaxID=172846 RepID=A0AAV4X8W1_CAEEX|nr:hypothetical protein CEXT_723141 [Caerostris extrusa]